MVHLVEKQTGGKQVPWPVADAELKAESPGGRIKTSEIGGAQGADLREAGSSRTPEAQNWESGKQRPLGKQLDRQEALSGSQGFSPPPPRIR